MAIPPLAAQPNWYFQPNFAFGLDGTLFATEDHQIMRFAADGTKECYAGCGETPYAPGVTARDLRFFPVPQPIAIDRTGVLYVGAFTQGFPNPAGNGLVLSRVRLVAIDPDGSVRLAQEEYDETYGGAFAVDPTGELIYNQPLPILSPALPIFRARTDNSEFAPIPDSDLLPSEFRSLHVDKNRNLWRSSVQAGQARLERFTLAGERSEFEVPDRFSEIVVRASDPQGNLYAIGLVGDSPPDQWSEVLRMDAAGQWETLGGVAADPGDPNVPLILGLGPRPASTADLATVFLGRSPYGFLCLSLGLPRTSPLAERNPLALDLLPPGAVLSTLGCIDDEGVVRSYFDFGFEGPFLSAVANAASGSVSAVAPGSWVSLYGGNLAAALEIANVAPLPDTLGGTTFVLTDANGTGHPVQLQFVSGTQVNLLIPPDAALGPATLAATTEAAPNAAHGMIEFEVAPVSPGLFSADNSGGGAAAAFALRIDRSGNRDQSLIYEFNPDLGRIVLRPIPINPDFDELYLILYGTGVRGVSSVEGVRAFVGGVEVPVLYAGPQGEFAGLDQINIGPLPASLKESPGAVDIMITVDGVVANIVQVGLF